MVNSIYTEAVLVLTHSLLALHQLGANLLRGLSALVLTDGKRSNHKSAVNNLYRYHVHCQSFLSYFKKVKTNGLALPCS